MTRRVIIAVEGPHDDAFVAKVLSVAFGLKNILYLRDVPAYWERTIPKVFPANSDGDLRRRVQLPSLLAAENIHVAIVNAGGNADIAQQTADTIKMLPSPPDAVGIVLDADSTIDPVARFEKLQADLRACRLPVPLVIGAVASAPGVPRCGVFVVPDNAHPGTLEDLLLECAEISYPSVLSRALEYVATVEEMQLLAPDLKEFRKPAGRPKATVAAISAILKPGKAMQNTIGDNRWVTQESLLGARLLAFSKFLGELMGSSS